MRPRIPKVVAGGLAAAVLTAAIGGAAFAQVSSPFSFEPQAKPVACGTCVPIGTQIDATP